MCISFCMLIAIERMVWLRRVCAMLFTLSSTGSSACKWMACRRWSPIEKCSCDIDEACARLRRATTLACSSLAERRSTSIERMCACIFVTALSVFGSSMGFDDLSDRRSESMITLTLAVSFFPAVADAAFFHMSAIVGFAPGGGRRAWWPLPRGRKLWRFCKWHSC